MTREQQLTNRAYRLASAVIDERKDPLAMVCLADAIETAAKKYAAAPSVRSGE